MIRPDTEAIRRRCEAATAGPWTWAEREYNDSIAPFRGKTRRALPGRNIRRCVVYWLRGTLRGGVQPQHADEHDYRTVLALRWESLGRKSSLWGMEAGPSAPDAAFNASARTDIPALLDYVRELEARP